MNQLRGWSIPILTTCLVHGAITILPIHFGKKNNQLDDTAITFKLVSLPQLSPSPSGKHVQHAEQPEQSVFTPEKKPAPPKEVYQDKIVTPAPARPIARSHSKAREKTEIQQSAVTQGAPNTSDANAMQSGSSHTSSGTSLGTGTSSGPVMLSSELSVICPVLNAPAYPRQSRQLGEHGELMLKLELDESGHVKKTQVINSSGYRRLDEAAIAAVKTWRCNPPLQNGQPVRAIALQSFRFRLQE